MRIASVCLLALMLAACGGKKSSGTGEGESRPSTFEHSMGEGDNSGGTKSGKSGASSKAGNDSGKSGAGGASNGASTDKPKEAEPAPEPIKPAAWTDIEGKRTEFKHVVALWDEVNHSVRVVVCTEAIADAALARLRVGEPLEAEVPHVMLSFVLEEGAKTASAGAVENQYYVFHHLTSLSPMQFLNLGKEAIKELSGAAKVGGKLRIVIEFRSETIKDGPAEKVHFDIKQELELK